MRSDVDIMKKKPYKKVYVEITNRCNLSCSFCIKNQRIIKELSKEEFIFILKKLKPYTNYLYFHVLGEPLIHSNINEFIDIASEEYFVNITTNGYLMKKIKDNNNIRQVNVSLHSFDPKYKVSLLEYLDNVFNVVDNLIKNNTYVSLRLWVENPYSNEMLEYIEKRYKCKICFEGNICRIAKCLFINKEKEFIWPNLDNGYYNEVGTCYGLRDHFGILVDGTIIPCCLDSKGIISLGNIYEDELDNVLSSMRCQIMIKGFQNNKKVEEFCKHCSFLE